MEETATTQDPAFEETSFAQSEIEGEGDSAAAPTDAEEETKQEATGAEANPDLVLTRKVNGLSHLLRTYYAQAAKGNATASPLRGQGRVLALLAMRPNATQKELQLILDMKQQSLSELLAKLEAKGYITRERSGKDGRMVIVHLTEAGAAAAPNLSESAEVPSPFDCLDADARTRFERDIDALTAALKERMGDEAAHGHDHDGEEGDQKRHRHGQQGRGGKGGHGKGHGKGGHGGAAALTGSAAGSLPLGDIALQVLGAAAGGGRGGRAAGIGGLSSALGGGRGAGRGGSGHGRGGKH